MRRTARGQGAGRPRRLFRLFGVVLPWTAVLAACSTDPGSDPETFAIPSATVAPIRMDVCKPGTFIGTMTVNCPQAVK